MRTIAEIRDGLAEALAGVPGTIQVLLLGGDYDESTEQFAVRVLVGEPSAENEARLDELLASAGEHSLRALLEADPTLGGVITTLAVRKHEGHRAYPLPDKTVLLGSTICLDVYR